MPNLAQESTISTPLVQSKDTPGPIRFHSELILSLSVLCIRDFIRRKPDLDFFNLFPLALWYSNIELTLLRQ